MALKKKKPQQTGTEDWKSKARRRLKEKKEGNTIKIVEGTNYLRIMPHAKGTKNPPYTEFRVHRNVGPDNKFVTCGKDLDGRGKCWLCDVQIPKLEASNIKSKRKKAEEMASKEQLFLIASRIDSDTKKWSKPKPWWVSTGNSAKSLSVVVLNMMANSKSRSFDDPVKGHSFTISRTGMGMRDTRYDPPEPDESPSKVPASILELVKPFSEYLDEYDAEDQKAAYFNREREEDEDEEEESDEEESSEESEEGEEGESEEESEGEEEEEAEGESEESEEEESESEEESETEDEEEGESEGEEESSEEEGEEEESEEEEEEAEVEEEEEEEAPPKKPAKKTGKPTPKPKPKPAPSKKPIKKKK